MLTAALCALCLFQFRKVFFDYNLLNMQSKGLPAVVFEKKLIDSASKSVLFGAVVADSLEQAAALERQITNLSTVASVDSMTPFLQGDQAAKLAAIGAIKDELSSIHFAETDHEPSQCSGTQPDPSLHPRIPWPCSHGDRKSRRNQPDVPTPFVANSHWRSAPASGQR